MIRHVALFRFKSGTAASEIDRLMAGIESLRDQVAGMTSLDRGVDFSSRAGGHTHAVVMSFHDRAALNAFYEHPAHHLVINNLMKPILDDLLIVDFQSSSAHAGIAS